MRGGHLVVVVCKRGIERDCFLEYFDRFLVSAGTLVCLAQVKIRIGIVWLLLRRLLEQRDRRFKLPVHDVEDAEIEVGEILFRIRSQLDLELFCRIGDSSGAVLKQVSQPEIVVNARELRIERDCFFELLDRLRRETGLAISAPDEYAQRDRKSVV